MNSLTTRLSLPAAALLLAAAPAWSAADDANSFHGEVMPREAELRVLGIAPGGASALTREHVLAELAEARRAGTLTPGGEVGDTDLVLVARERYIVAQAAEIVARHEAERAAQAAAAAEEAARVAAAEAAARVATAPATEAAAGALPQEGPGAGVSAADSLSARESLVTAPAPVAPLPAPKVEARPEAIKNEERPDLSEASATDRG